MAGVSYRAAGIIAILALALYHTFLRDVMNKVGIGRTLETISDFPYQCRRISHSDFEACEDMWLDETNRQLYLACSNMASRRFWNPNMGILNESALHMKDAIIALDIDKPVGDSFAYRPIATSSFYGTAGEGSLHTLSISGRKLPTSSKIELYLINNKPSLQNSAVVELANNALTGANSTIELFELEPGSSFMRHVHTFAHPLIATPNNVAPLPDGSGFYLTNDHGLHKSGFKHTISPYLSTGNVVYCTNPRVHGADSSTPPTCRIVATGLSFPNGLAIHPSDPKTLYVPSAAIGTGVSIFKIHPGGRLTKLQDLLVPYPIDNLSPSSDGAIYAAAFPKMFETLRYMESLDTFDPSIAAAQRKAPPATMLRISTTKNLINDGKEVSWSWDKVVEDALGQLLPMATTALRDGKTGRLFMSGINSYFITVCEPL